MKLKQLLPRGYPDFFIIATVCASLVVTIAEARSGEVASAIVCGIFTLLSCGGYCLIVYVNVLNDRDRQRRESRWDEVAHQQEREEMMK